MQMTLTVVQMVITAITAIAASSGFWIYVNRKRDTKQLSRRLLIGLAHDRIICLAMKYIDRGFITQDEYKSLYTYLYKPYIAMGANGSFKRLMKEVDKLPLFDEEAHIKSKLESKRRNEDDDLK